MAIARLRALTKQIVRLLAIRDVARASTIDWPKTVASTLEVNALPALDHSSSVMLATRREGFSFDATINAILASSAMRAGAASFRRCQAKQNKVQRAAERKVRIGFAFNVKRPGGKAQGRRGSGIRFTDDDCCLPARLSRSVTKWFSWKQQRASDASQRSAGRSGVQHRGRCLGSQTEAQVLRCVSWDWRTVHRK